MGTVLEMMRPLALAFAATLTVAACGNDPESFVGARVLQSSLAEQTKGLTKRKAAAPAPVQVTRAALATVETPVILMTVESRGQHALIAEVADNLGVQTWSTVDDVTVSMKNGVVVATRGFGADLMAASVPNPAVLQSAAKSYGRIHTYLDGTDRAVQMNFTCNVTNLGAQAIEVVEIVYQTRHVSETCTGNGIEFTNEYWLDGSAHIRKSRQLVSQDAGYLVIEDLRR